MQFNDYLIERSIPVSSALTRLESNEYKVLCVVDGDNRLCGVVTDGDVRRYLISGGSLDGGVGGAASDKPTTVHGFHEGAARALLTGSDLTCVPMTDDDGIVHALVFEQFTLHREIFDIDCPVVMMAGGFGTRLLPYTEILPKPLMPIGSKTITEHIIERFKKFGCRNFTLIVNYKRNLIKSYFSEVDAGCNLEFIDETEPLGTGGGLYCFRDRCDGPMFVVNCDSVVEADYREIVRRHIEDENAVTMVCARQTIRIPYGVIDTDENSAVIGMREKPSLEYLMNTGFYVVNSDFLSYVEKDKFQPITDIIERCRADGKRVGAYIVPGECFIDIGQLDDLKNVGLNLR